MWLKKELETLQIDTLSFRQQLDLLQDNAYIRCNLDSIIGTRNTFNLVTKEENTDSGINLRYDQESNIAWDNICTYLRILFPKVWNTICESNILPVNTFTFSNLSQLKNLDGKIHSCKKLLEVFKSLVYGSSLRLPFSQDIRLQNLYSNLLILCQQSDISGIQNIAGQRRILFLQSWTEKLVLSSSLPSYLIETLNNTSPVQFIGKEPALVTNKKYIATKRSGPTPLLIQPNNSCATSHSSKSCITTFSSYLNKQVPTSSKFIGIKLKFDPLDSDSSCLSESSDNSIWNPVFKKKKFS